MRSALDATPQAKQGQARHCSRVTAHLRASHSQLDRVPAPTRSPPSPTFTSDTRNRAASTYLAISRSPPSLTILTGCPSGSGVLYDASVDTSEPMDVDPAPDAAVVEGCADDGLRAARVVSAAVVKAAAEARAANSSAVNVR